MAECAMDNCKNKGTITAIYILRSHTTDEKICSTHNEEFRYRVCNDRCGWCGKDPIEKMATEWCGKCDHTFLN